MKKMPNDNLEQDFDSQRMDGGTENPNTGTEEPETSVSDETQQKSLKKRKVVIPVVALSICALAGGVAFAQSTMRNDTSQAVSEKEDITPVAKKKDTSASVDITKLEKQVKDLYICIDSKNIDWEKFLDYSEKSVKDVQVDASKINLEKAGTYELRYIITDAANKKTTITSKVSVVTKEEAEKLADSGKTVWTDNNKTFVAANDKSKENEKDTKETSKETNAKEDSGNASNVPNNGNTTAIGSTGGSSSSNGSNGSNGGSGSASGGSSSGGSSSSSGSTAPPTPTVHAPLYRDIWIDTSWTEYKDVYEWQERAICKGCGADVTANAYEHCFEDADVNSPCINGYRGEVRYVYVRTDVIPHNEGHWEKQLVCSGCTGTH